MSFYRLGVVFCYITILYSCTNESQKQEVSKTSSFNETHFVSDSHIIDLVITRNWSSKDFKDSIPIDSSSWIYFLGKEDAMNIFLLVEDFGLSGHGNRVTVLHQLGDKLQRSQSFHAFVESPDNNSKSNIRSINLYYRDNAFDGVSPISVAYDWNGNKFEFSKINYVQSTSNYSFKGQLIKAMNLVKSIHKSENEPYFSVKFKETCDINHMSIDTIWSGGNHVHLLFKNEYKVLGLTNKIWIIEERNSEYTLLKEILMDDYHEVKYPREVDGLYPEIHFGSEKLKWNGVHWKGKK